MPNNNRNLHNAKKTQNDEFYTRYEDIQKELQHYKKYLIDKVVYCNCDDPKHSNFYIYLKEHFDEYGIKKLVATHYVPRTVDFLFGSAREYATKAVYDGSREIIENLNGDGSFDSSECLSILDEADVVITNPPFSRFRDFFSILIEYNVDFIILGSINALIYKDVFPHVKSGKLLVKQPNGGMKFIQPDGSIKGVACGWYSTFAESNKGFIELTETYSPERYPKYDNFDAIEVSSWKDVPKDYDGVMGVPLGGGFIKYFNPEQFEIIGCSRSDVGNCLMVNGKQTFQRVFIKNKHPWLRLTKTYNEKDYPSYLNYKAIEVSDINDIPKDYDGVMGVPINFMKVWNREQFELLGHVKGNAEYLHYCWPDGRKKVKDTWMQIHPDRRQWAEFVSRSPYVETNPEADDPKDRGYWCYARILIKNKHPWLRLTKTYNEKDYPRYDNFDAIEVSDINDIPKDYPGIMGVPLTFLTVWNKDQFEVLCKITGGWDEKDIRKEYGIPEGLKRTLEIRKQMGDKVFIERHACAPHIEVNPDAEDIKDRYKMTYAKVLIKNKHPWLRLTKTYNEKDYPRYLNYDAIEVSRTEDIPKDYSGIMGVPTSFIHVWNRDQFDLLCITKPEHKGYEKYIIKEGCDKVKRISQERWPNLGYHSLMKVNAYIETNPDAENPKDRGYFPFARILIKHKT